MHAGSVFQWTAESISVVQAQVEGYFTLDNSEDTDMPRETASQLIFSRRLETVNDCRPVNVKIFAPQPSLRHAGEWVCRYSISRIGPKKSMRAIGVDSLQAFLIAYNHIASILTENESNLAFDGSSVRLSFPRLLPYYGDEFGRRLDGVIHAEVDRYCKQLEHKLARRKKQMP